jgi:hypothetical protein
VPDRISHVDNLYCEGCIYSPFLIEHPQPLRSYLENASQYPQLKPSTTHRPHAHKHSLWSSLHSEST